ncbi:MAG TPA: thioesterase family protein [Bacillota bacterium]
MGHYQTRIAFHEIDYGRVIFHGAVHGIVQKALEELYLDAGIDLRQLFREQRIGIPIVESRCVFVAPLLYLDLVEVRCGIADLTPKGYRMLFNLYVLPDERLAVAGHLRHRFVDTRQFRGVEASEEVLAAFRRLEPGEPLVDSVTAYRYDD